MNRPVDIQVIGSDLAIKWDSERESFIPLETLRRHCPCAGCQGEKDIMGNLYKNPSKPFRPEAFKLVRFIPVGNYAVSVFWGDGHNTGYYSFDYLKGLSDAIAAQE